MLAMYIFMFFLGFFVGSGVGYLALSWLHLEMRYQPWGRPGEWICRSRFWDYTRMKSQRAAWARLKIDRYVIYERNREFSGLPGRKSANWNGLTIDLFGREIIRFSNAVRG